MWESPYAPTHFGLHSLLLSSAHGCKMAEHNRGHKLQPLCIDQIEDRNKESYENNKQRIVERRASENWDYCQSNDWIGNISADVAVDSKQLNGFL